MRLGLDRLPPGLRGCLRDRLWSRACLLDRFARRQCIRCGRLLRNQIFSPERPGRLLLPLKATLFRLRRLGRTGCLRCLGVAPFMLLRGIGRLLTQLGWVGLRCGRHAAVRARGIVLRKWLLRLEARVAGSRLALGFHSTALFGLVRAQLLLMPF